MELDRLLPLLLGTAWLLPLASFALLVFFGPRLGKHGKGAAYVATAAIGLGFVLSAAALVAWLGQHPLAGHGEATAVSGDWYALGVFGDLRITIGYYIDSLTVAMFSMVTLVATCIHVYSFGYMHEELHEVTDPLVTLSDGSTLKRPGRFSRFYQYLSLFCFSMLGLVIAGNVAMVFVFWELVGICSYFLIGFYRERKSASNAANKAFIVNRVGDFGMIVGLMALWSGLGTFSFGNYRVASADGETVERPGMFTQVRPTAEDVQRFGLSEAGHEHALIVPDGMVRYAARDQVAEIHRSFVVPPLGGKKTEADPVASDFANTAAAIPPKGGTTNETAEAKIQSLLPRWRAQGYGYWLLVIAGLGIFCGCVGKSAQFPLHVWLPDAMEGPTPVSALIHAATMVAAGVYLVGRFYSVFTPEVLLVIAAVGCITLFIAATIALTATDIKRVLAYSTVSQLGYMMFALGIGGWLAGLFHLFTHAFFKALLFLGSGSVIHATGTNEMPRMGGLLKKMPWTAGTMLVGCLAIAGAGIPLVIGLSGYYSKDAIIAQAFVFQHENALLGWMFYVAAGGAALTAFYMFRLWFMTFVGPAREPKIHHHAHESPWAMVGPLVVLAVLAVVAGWPILGMTSLLDQARPAGVEETVAGQVWPAAVVPSEALSHDEHVHHLASWIAFAVAAAGFLVAMLFYGVRVLSADVVRKLLAPVHWFLWNKWFFDELYNWLFIRPAHAVAALAAWFDRTVIDGLANGLAWLIRVGASLDNLIDRLFVDGLVDGTARAVHAVGLWLRTLQTGLVRQYVMILGVGTVALFVLISFLRHYAFAAL